MRGAIEQSTDLPAGAKLIGYYAFSHGDEAAVWTPGALGETA